MVVSKDSKRKRKESPLIESSPEMPKRTKVQAQRKFAQGQSAPTSSYSSALASSSTATQSTSSANTSSQENRDPPTEILPNKRPKTEDFLTFLCFRGTSALPAHLDFLNQNTARAAKDESPPNSDEKNKADEESRDKPVTPKPKGATSKKRDKGTTVDESSTSTASGQKSENATTKKSNSKNTEEPKDTKVIAFAVRKRAEQLPEGNRRGRAAEKAREKLNKTTEGNRRSFRNRDSTKCLAEREDTDGDNVDLEVTSVESTNAKTIKTIPQKGKRNKSSQPIKKKIEQDAITNAEAANDLECLSGKEVPREESTIPNKTIQAKEKPIKRPRQKETPIFVPSSEPTGRMTRQRAFFEPVKVVHEEKPEEKPDKTPDDNAIQEKPSTTTTDADKDDPSKDVFDFSSEDEQPLAKAIKIKVMKMQPGKKYNQKKTQKNATTKNKDDPESTEETPSTVDPKPADTSKSETKIKSDDEEIVEKSKSKKPEKEPTEKATPEKPKKPPGRKPKKKITDEPEKPDHEVDDSTKAESEVKNLEDGKNTPASVVEITTRKSRSKTAANCTPESEAKHTRPTRKTKEAATIYMGIIGQKLQQNDFEDDDMSMDSFPDLPNVKEVEKMETELKKNADQLKQSNKTSATTDAQKSDVKQSPKSSEKPPARRGRPPKNPPAKIAKQKLTPPSQMEGILRKREEPKTDIVDEKEDDEDFLLNEEVKETKRKLEKSFSDSDDEPLAIKLTKTSERDSDNSKKSEITPLRAFPISRPDETRTAPKMLNLLPLTAPAPALTTNITPLNSSLIENKNKVDDKPKLISSLAIPAPPYIPRQPIIKSPQTHPPLPPVQPPVKYQTPPTTYPPPIEAYPSPKINPNFLTPKFDRNIDRRIVCLDGSSPISTLQRSSTFPSQSPIKLDLPAAKSLNTTTTTKLSPIIPSAPVTSSSTQADPLKDEIGTILAANLMPSKEESVKIFGIASVSLAQSSGPDNTKCTLGKCGSIHKPVLGPVVPTESYVGEQLSSKERRKAKVNMTHEQIQKWLIECSSNPDEIHDDLEEEYDDNLRPNLYTTTPPPVRDDKESTSFSSSSKTTRDLGKSESAWSGKGPSLKATPVVLPKDDPRQEEGSLSSDALNKESKDTLKELPTQKTTGVGKKNEAVNKLKEKPKNEKPLKDDKEIKKVQEKITRVAAPQRVGRPVKSASTTPTSSPRHQKKTDENKSNSATSPPSKLRTGTPTNNTRTPRKPTVYNTKFKESPILSNKKKLPLTSSFGAFSADNEKSVYSFDKEEDDNSKITLSKPFRRQSCRESHAEETSHDSQKNSTDKKENNAQNSVSVTLSPEENSKLVKVSLEAEQAKSVEPPEKTSEFKTMADGDEDTHTFYIPLQGAGQAGIGEGKTDLIQGVAVKLGREGPDGPNQKVVMHATLVTKSQMGSNSKPLPDSMNVSDIVKNLIGSATLGGTKESNVPPPIAPSATTAGSTTTNTSTTTQNANTTTANPSANPPAAPVSSSKSVPVGTVQPRFKSTEGNAAAAQQNNPSASGSGGGALTRVNSNSSLFSGSNKSRGPVVKKIKDDTPIKMCNNTAFPRHDDPTQMVEAPIFRPTEKEFQDPMEFIDRITPIAARFGICKIIPPPSFKPECRVSDDMRFTAYNQYVHKMLHRWGPSAKELSAIKKYLATQSIVMNHPPWIGGMEVDLPRLYHTVQELGGLKEVIEKKKWARVAEEMCIPKLAQDRMTKLDDIYCKYLLPYDTLSPSERQKLFDEVEADWAKREARARRNADRFVNTDSVSNEDDDVSTEDDEESEEEVDGVSMECIVKGRSMPLNQFYRIARNTMSLWFKNSEPSVTEVEAEFWRHVAVRDSHVCVHSGSIDSSGWGYGFPGPGPKGKGSTCAKHPWNLKILTNNAGSVLRSLGPVMGVTVPTLHVGMLFSACCWYRDPHGLSWIEYLHTGASKLWYGIPDDQSSNFRAALTSLIPTHCQNKTIWLPCDTVMVPPHMLTDRGVSLCRIEQKPGEFVVVFPRAYTSSVATGYVVSESVYFATSSWLELGKDDFRDIHDSCEPAMFSLEQLLFALASDQRVSADVLSQMLPMINEVHEKEVAAREQLKAAGVTSTEKIPTEKPTKSKKQQPVAIQNECDLCRANLYISMVKTDEGNLFCLQHALKNLNKGNIQAKQCKLIFSYNIEDIDNLIKTLKDRLAQKRIAINKKSK